jgi:F0F1-type ATP synthase assembly protein I
MTKIVDDRSPMAIAMSKVSEIITICLMMILPALIGYWLDQKLNTVLLLTIAGLAIGLVGAIYQLRRLVASLNRGVQSRKTDDSDESGSS